MSYYNLDKSSILCPSIDLCWPLVIIIVTGLYLPVAEVDPEIIPYLR